MLLLSTLWIWIKARFFIGGIFLGGGLVKVFVLTWNMANSVVDKKDVSAFAKKIQSADIILVQAQEETLEPNCNLSDLLLKNLPNFKQVKRSSFEVQTSLITPGQLSSTVLVRKGIHAEAQEKGKYYERDDKALVRNKGGIASQISFLHGKDKFKLQVISAHLASKNDAKKIQETSSLFQLIEQDRLATYADLESMSSDLTIVAGDLNYRNIHANGAPLSPFLKLAHQPAVAEHFFMRGLNLPETCNLEKQFTYAGKGYNNLAAQRPHRRDSSRVAGALDAPYCKGGFLDLVLHRKDADVVDEGKFEVIDKFESKGVDHKPVLAEFELCNAKNNYERTKAWLVNLLKSIESNGIVVDNRILEAIETAKESPKAKLLFVNTYNYFIGVQQLQIQGEYFRAQQDQELTQAINGKDGLVAGLLKAGNKYILENKNKELAADVMEISRKAFEKTPRLKEVESVWLKLQDFILRVITLGTMRLESRVEQRIGVLTSCCSVLFRTNNAASINRNFGSRTVPVP